MKFLAALRKQFTLFPFSWCAGLTVAHCHCGRGSGGREGPQKAEGSRCSEMHFQPYQRCFFLVCRAVWPEPNFFFMESEHNYFFQRISGHDYFFQRISGHDYFFQFYTRPPPPPWISNGQCLNGFICNYVEFRLSFV